jgi:MYXO-CTERM domain-containing protein
VAAGYVVTVFDEDNFAGESVTLTSALACFVDKNFNDRMSSLRVRSLEPVEPGDGDQGGDGDQMSGDGDQQPGDGDGDGDSGDGDGDAQPGDGDGDGDDGDGDGDGDSDANGDGDGDSDQDPTTPPLAGACSVQPTGHRNALGALLGWVSVLGFLAVRRRRT